MSLYINMSMYNNVMYNYVQHYAIEMIKKDILNVLIDIDNIPNYNYYIFLHFRGACIHL